MSLLISCVKVESTLMGLRSPARFSSVGFWDRFDEDPVWSYLRNVQIHSPPAFCQGGIKPILDGRDTIGQAQFEAETVFPCVSCRLLVKACLWRPWGAGFRLHDVYEFLVPSHTDSIAYPLRSSSANPGPERGKTATFAGHSVGEGISISVSWKFMKCTAQAQQKLFRSQVCQKSQSIFFRMLDTFKPFRMLDKFLSHCSVSLCMYFCCMQCPRWLARCSASTLWAPHAGIDLGTYSGACQSETGKDMMHDKMPPDSTR